MFLEIIGYDAQMHVMQNAVLLTDSSVFINSLILIN